MSRTQNEPTLAGWLMLVVARQLPLALSEHLMRMLGELLGAERGPDLREVRLGLVFELMWRDAAPIDADGYDEERRVRGLLGEDWPNSSTLAGHFGGWTAVQQAALDLYRVGTVARVSGRGKQAPEDRGADAYSRQEIVDAVVPLSRVDGPLAARRGGVPGVGGRRAQDADRRIPTREDGR